MSAFFYFQPTLKMLVNNCIAQSYADIILIFLKYEGRRKKRGLKRVFSKRPALLGLN